MALELSDQNGFFWDGAGVYYMEKAMCADSYLVVVGNDNNILAVFSVLYQYQEDYDSCFHYKGDIWCQLDKTSRGSFDSSFTEHFVNLDWSEKDPETSIPAGYVLDLLANALIHGVDHSLRYFLMDHKDDIPLQCVPFLYRLPLKDPIYDLVDKYVPELGLIIKADKKLRMKRKISKMADTLDSLKRKLAETSIIVCARDQCGEIMEHDEVSGWTECPCCSCPICPLCTKNYGYNEESGCMAVMATQKKKKRTK